MSNFKSATRQKLRFNTSKGVLSTEQVWDLGITSLAGIVRNLKKELNKDSDDELAFLDDTSAPVDETVELRFNIVKEIYLAKKAERDSIKTEAAKKEHNQKILAEMARRKEESITKVSDEELEKMLQQ